MVNGNEDADDSRIERSQTAGAAPSGQGRGTYSRRKFVAPKGGGKSATGGAAAGGAAKVKHVNLDAVDDALNEDATTVEVMRREVLDSQKMELAQARAELAQLRRTHDRLKDETHAKQKLAKELARQLAELRRMANPENFRQAPGETRTALTVDQIEAQVQENHRRVRAALVQKQSLGHMLRRLTQEILAIKKSTKTLQQRMRTVDNELASSTLHYQHAKQELTNEERRLAGLRSKVDARRRQQDERMQGLEKIMEERSVILERQEERIKKRDEIIARSAGAMLEDEEERLKRAYVVRNVYSTVLEERVGEHREALAKLELTFQQIKNVTGLSDVDAIVAKFLGRAAKNEQLEALAEEVRGRIEGLKAGNLQLKQQLADLASAAEVSAGNREVYQEVDLIDEALASARKHCEEAKSKANRLHVTLDSLRDALVRFVRKVDSLPAVAAAGAAAPGTATHADRAESGLGGTDGSHGGGATTPGLGGRAPSARGVATAGGGPPGTRGGAVGGGGGDASALSLPDLVTLLDTKVTQVMKAVNAAMIKDTHDMAGGGGDGTKTLASAAASRRGSAGEGAAGDPLRASTESAKELSFSKLDASNVSRLLYRSLMGAEPDVSARNLRAQRRGSLGTGRPGRQLLGGLDEDAPTVDSDSEGEDPHFYGGGGGAEGAGGGGGEGGGGEDGGGGAAGNGGAKADELREATLDRAMVKKVSSMILARDQGGKKKRRGRAGSGANN